MTFNPVQTFYMLFMYAVFVLLSCENNMIMIVTVEAEQC